MTLEQNSEYFKEFENRILTSKPFEEYVSKLRDRKNNEIEQWACDYKKELTNEIQSQQQSYEYLKIECNTLDNQCIAKKIEFTNFTEKIQKEVDRVRSMLEMVSPSELPFARQFAERLEDYLGLTKDLFPSHTAPWACFQLGEVSKKITVEALPERIAEEKGFGLSLEIFKSLDAFLRAGELVWLSGRGKDWYLERYCACVTGGKCYRMQADPSTLNLDDLWRLPGTREPTAFAHAWTVASRSNEAQFVIIHISESPCHLWLPALFTVLQSPLRPRNLLVACVVDAILPCDRAEELSNCFVALHTPGIDCEGIQKVKFIRGTLPQATLLCMQSAPAELCMDCYDDIKTAGSLKRVRKLALASPEIQQANPAWPDTTQENSCIAEGKLKLCQFFKGMVQADD